MIRFLLIFLILMAQASSAQENALVESFEEKGIFWRLADWGDGADLTINTTEATHGGSSLQLHFNTRHADRGKGLVLERDLTALPVEFDRIVVDIWSGAGDQQLSIALAIDTDQYYESKSLQLNSGWNRNILFDLTQSTYKSASTQWNNSAPVRRDQLAKKIMFLIYKNGVKEARLLIDQVRLQKLTDPCADCASKRPRSRIKSQPSNHPIPRELPLEIFLRRTS